MFAPLVIVLLITLTFAESTHTFVEVVTGTSSYVPVNAQINNDNHLVYSTVEGAASTTTYVDPNGYLTTSFAGGREIETTANNNYVSEEYTLTTTLINTQIVDFGAFYTTTTYDSNGGAHLDYVMQNPNIIQTVTSWGNDGHPKTYYLSASEHDNTYSFATIDASTVSSQLVEAPTTISSMSSFSYSGTWSISQSHKNAGVSGPIAGAAGIFAGAIAAIFL